MSSTDVNTMSGFVKAKKNRIFLLNMSLVIAVLESPLTVGLFLLLFKHSYLKYSGIFVMLLIIIYIQVIKKNKYRKAYIEIDRNFLTIEFGEEHIRVSAENIAGVREFSQKISKPMYWKNLFLQDNSLFFVLSKAEPLIKIELLSPVEIRRKHKASVTIDSIVLNDIDGKNQLNKNVVSVERKGGTQSLICTENVLQAQTFPEAAKTNGPQEVLTVQNIRKSYGNKLALVDVSFVLPSRSIVCLVGENGAGKTTTIGIIMGVQKCDQGNVLFWGKREIVKNIGHKIGYVPDESILYEKFKVKDFFLFIGDIYRIDKSKIKKLIEQYCEYFQINKYLDDYIFELSLGTKKKVMLISSLLYDPELFIMDEPFSSLDPISQWKLKELLLKLRAAGKTFLISSHSLNLVEEISSELLIIQNGLIVFKGKPEEIKSKTSKNTLLDAYISFLMR